MLSEHFFALLYTFDPFGVRKLYCKKENIALDTGITPATPKDLYSLDQYHDFFEVPVGPQHYEFISWVGTRVKNLQVGVWTASISVSLDLSVFSYIERIEVAQEICSAAETKSCVTKSSLLAN